MILQKKVCWFSLTHNDEHSTITILTSTLCVCVCVCVHVGAWYGVLAIVSQLAVVTNAILIAITSNFVGFEVYRRGGYQDHYNDKNNGSLLVPQVNGHEQGLSGYVNWSTTEFLVGDLVDGSAFPVYSAQRLVLVNDDGTDVVREDGKEIDEDDPPLYLPFINFPCIEEQKESYGCSVTEPQNFTVTRLNGEDMNVPTYTEKQYKGFYENSKCRELVFDVDENTSPSGYNSSGCFDSSHICR